MACAIALCAEALQAESLDWAVATLEDTYPCKKISGRKWFIVLKLAPK